MAQLPEGFQLVGYAPDGSGQQGDTPQQSPQLPEGFQLVGYDPSQQEQPTLIERAGRGIKEAFTGAERTTEELESLDLIMDAPELNSLSTGAFKASLGFLMTGDSERQKDIIERNYPDAQFRQDEKGNYIVQLESGEYALQKPGLDLTDLASTFVQGGLSYLSGGFGAGLARGAGLGIRGTAGTLAAAEGVTSAAREVAINEAGGGYVPSNIATDVLLTGTLEAAPRAIQGLSRQKRLDAVNAQRAARDAEAQRIANPLSPESQLNQTNAAIADVAEAAKADRSLFKRSKDLPEDLQLSQDVIEAGKEFGQEVPLGVAISDPAQRRSVQGIASQHESQLGDKFYKGLEQTRNSANELIKEFGGSDNKAGLAGELRTTLQDTIEDLSKSAEHLYSGISKQVDQRGLVNVDEIRQVILDEADNLSRKSTEKGISKLDPLRKRLLGTLDADDTTFQLLDRERKAVGAAIGEARGVYKDQSSADLNTMYSLLTDAQENALNAIDPQLARQWSEGKALVSQRKTLEDQSIKVLGKELTGDLFNKLGKGVQQLGGRTGYSKQLTEVLDLLDKMPKDLREEVVASSLSFGFSATGQSSEQLGLKGFNSFYKNLNKNPEAKEQLFKHLPAGAKQRMDRFNVLTEAYQKAQQDMLHTGKVLDTYKGFDTQGLPSKLYGGVQDAIAKKLPFGEEIIKLSGRNKNEPLTHAADKMLADPKFKNLAFSYAGTSTKAKRTQEKAAKALEKSNTYKQWVDLLPEDDRLMLGRIGVVNFFRDSQSEDEQRLTQ